MLPNSIASYLSDLFVSSKFADITIKAADGSELKASKLVLSRSPVFDAMLNQHDTKEAQDGVIEISDIDHEVLKELIHYMYSDEIPKLKDIALDLLIAANKYDLPGLFETCKSYLMANFSLEDFPRVLIFAEKLDIDDLKKVTMQHIIADSENIFASNEWKLFEKTNADLAMQVMKNCIEKLKVKAQK